MAFDGSSTFEVQAPDLKGQDIVDTTGAGDAFGAGFLASLLSNAKGHRLDGENVEKALEMGCRVGTACCLQVYHCTY